MRAMILTNVLGPALLIQETLPHLQIADTIVFAVNQPAGVDINHITVRPTGQAG
ncbi:hypothetical protein ACIBCO_37475 [Streptomyces violascens]|uniref:hypothetical protein n=1 Tax=Streptomyces violascens TaxID=67381 RepID=UPI0037A3ACE4